jgi:hypothetical protein
MWHTICGSEPSEQYGPRKPRQFQEIILLEGSDSHLRGGLLFVLVALGRSHVVGVRVGAGAGGRWFAA